MALGVVVVGAGAGSPRNAGPPLTAELLTKGRLAGPVVLRANAAARGSRVVAVTFVLDGRALGTDTTAPYALDVDAALLPRGRHRLVAEAVDALGRRARSRSAAVTIGGRSLSAIVASPRRNLTRALAALRRGNVTVRLLPGRYTLREVELGSGSRLIGSGPRTVIAPPDGAGYWALLVAKGRGIRVSNLAFDGGGPGPGEGIALAVFDGSRDVRLQRVQMRRVRGFGVSVWGAHDEVSVQDSQIDGGGTARAGVYALGSDESRNTSVIRTRVRGFRDFGILFEQREYRRPAAALHPVALDNVVSDVRDPARAKCLQEPRETPGCGTNEGGIWTGGVEAAIIGNVVRRTRWTGIETVGSSTRTSVVGNDIAGARTGIYVERSTNESLFSRNTITNVETGINVEWKHGGGESDANRFSFNRIVDARDAGLFVDVGADTNRIVGNRFVRGARPVIILQGSSRNLVRANSACGRPGKDFVREQSARWEDGAPAHSSNNLVGGNTSRSRCG
ncbi:MAG: right-handed parallel beta-helix repeat-containing protein [Actinomycetota bacterium]|nr:right-handed parallel beta-helix repeat-containing protein [Actinomycetota bacterium]